MTAKKNNLALVVVGLLLGMLMASMDNTIVATAMGTIVGELGGLDKFVWVTSAYMVAEMAGMPIFGKLSDMYGRKRFFIFGLIVFLAGSILCGTANSIVELSIYRAIQGIGGGALIPIAFTILFDIFPPEKRGKMGGLFGAVFGLSSIFGPLLGAYITDYLHWRWVFYINLPLGFIALIMIAAFYRESPMHTRQKIDWVGAATLVGAVVCLMFALELGGQKYAWDSVQIIGMFTGFAVLAVMFLTKVHEPIISFNLFKNKLYASSNIIGFFYSAAFIAGTIYIPIFIQGVLGGSATNSGLVLLPMMLGTTISAQLGGVFVSKTSFRNIMVLSALVFITSLVLLSTLTADSSRLTVTLYMILAGLGVGASFSVLNMAAINNLPATQRGSANATLGFLRELGMTLGITIFGILQRNDFSGKLTDIFAGSGGAAPQTTDPRALLTPEARAQIPEGILKQITEALSGSIALTFLWGLVPAVIALFFVFRMGKARMEGNGWGAPAPEAAEVGAVQPHERGGKALKRAEATE